MNLAVCAIARKLTVALWYLMSGHWTALQELDVALKQKVGKMISQVGPDGLKKMNKTRKAFREEVFQLLKSGKIYQLDEMQSRVERFAARFGLNKSMARFLYDGEKESLTL